MMPVSNQDIAALFERMALLLELEGANAFRVRAYHTAANLITNLSQNLPEMLAQGQDLDELPGIGKDLAEKIKQIAATGKLTQLQELEARIPRVLLEMLKLQGLGPKRARLLQQQLGLSSLADLRQAAQARKIRALEGFGPKLEEQILKSLDYRESHPDRLLWAEAEPVVESLLAYLRQSKNVLQAEAAGSFRRKKESVGDLDILVASHDPEACTRHFLNYPKIQQVLSQGSTRSTVLFQHELQVDLRVVPAESFGAALHYFTGSQAHNIAIRRLGQQLGFKINEYGVFRGSKSAAGKTEADLYRKLGLPYIEPELRENSGELAAARTRHLPSLVSLPDLRGDLHSHTLETDGVLSLAELAHAAEALGHAYLGVTDHSQRVSVARGMDAKRLAGQIRAIDHFNAKSRKLVLLKSCEVDILEDGSLDLPDSILQELDYCVCSVHSHFNLPRTQQTERILRAMDNPFFTILGHPTGRLLNQRPAYEMDLERIIQGCKQRGCFLELNSHPMRLDVTDTAAKRAKELGVLVAISSDAHSQPDLHNLRFGIHQARRGWLEAADVLNTRTLPELKKLLKRA